MKQVVDRPTRVTEKSSTMIDHVYLNHEDKLVSSGVISTGLTDHRLIYVVRRAVKPRFSPRRITARSFKYFNQKGSENDITNVPWHMIEMFDSVDDAWYSFKSLFLDVCD